MIIIGEKINSTRKSIKEAIANKDKKFLQKLAADQAAAGADYIDVNTGAFPEEEVELMTWLVDVVQEVVQIPLSIDSVNPAALAAGLKAHKNGKAIINSITAESEKFQHVLELAKEYQSPVLALSLNDQGITKTVEQRFAVAKDLIDSLCAEGIPEKNIYLDPLIQPVSVQNDFGVVALEVIKKVKQQYNNVKTTCGLSNVSFGLPNRPVINRCFLIMAISAGLDSAILDPLDSDMMQAVYAAQALLGKDRFCKNYIKAFRKMHG